jgi:hypothetical protein
MAEAISTQEQNPRSATIRTTAVAIVTLFPLLNLALAGALEALEPYRVYVPDFVFIWLNGALIVVTIIIAVVQRVMAVPGLNDWFRMHFRLLAPEDKPGKHEAQ